MPTENIRIVVAGANPQTFDVQAAIDNSGNATLTFPVTGVRLGADLVQAFLDIKNLSSNQAQVVWQGTNGPLAISPIQVYFQSGYAGSNVPSGINASGFNPTQIVNSLMFNTHPSNILPGDPHDSGNTANPMVNNAVTIGGTYSGDVTVSGDHGGAIYLALVGSFVVAQAGNITFTSYANQGYILGCPGATYVSGAATFAGVTATPIKNYPSLAGRNGSWPGGNYAVDNFTLNFPAPGVYPFEIIYASGEFGERQFDLLGPGSAVIPPVVMQPIPAAPPAGTGNLVLTPVNAGPDIQGTAQTFTLQIQNVVFQSKPYLPVFEGHSGQLYISNIPGSELFSFPTLLGSAGVDYPSALAALFTIAGDNASWQNRVSLATDGNDFKLVFSGNGVDANIAATLLTISQRDLAWFNAGNNSFDAFTISSQGGGSQVTVQINWLVAPAIASVGPSSLPGDGGTHTVAINLLKPLPPLQTNIQATFTGTGGVTVTNTLLNLNSNGFVTGWTLTVTTPVVGAATAATLVFDASGALTYLSGDDFVTETVTYATGDALTLNLVP